MPLQKKSEIKKLILPSSKDITEADKEWVLVECGPLMGGDMLNFDNFNNQNDFLAYILLHRIKEWSVKDDTTIAPINIESLRRLKVDDTTYLLAEFIKDDIGGEGDSDPKVILAA